MFLAEKIAALSLDITRKDIPDEALLWARTGTLDTVGVTLAGVNEPMLDILRNTPGLGESTGLSVVQGTGVRTSAMDAVFFNGVASHVHDYDDVSSTLGGHPSVMLSPVIQAIADVRRSDRPVSGEEAMVAYVAGYETIMRLSHGLNFHHYNKGWHPTVTIGIFGSIAAGARLLGLDQQQTSMALAQGVSLAGGVKANFGSMVKPLHIGHALRNALMACLTAQRGFLARPDAFEAPQGYLDVFNGEGNFDADAIVTNWGEPWDILDSGLGLKQFPCCGSTHAPINCALEIREMPGFKVDAVDSITVMTHPLRIPHTNTPDPKSLVQAKFSTQYVVARSLLDGAPRISDFEGNRPWESDVRALMDVTRFHAHPDMPMEGSNHFAGEVIVRMKSGESFSHRKDHQVGRGLPNPMSSQELWDKYRDCALRSIDEDAAKASFDQLMAIEELDDIAVINDTLCRERPASAASA